LLSRIRSGRSGKTLVKFELSEEATVPSAIPELKTLKETVTANWNKREQTEGRGKWQKYEFPHKLKERFVDGW